MAEFLALFELYKWVVIAGALLASGLAVLGCWVAARDQAMQTLCVGQGATLGVLLGIGLFTGTTLEHTGPFGTGVVAAFLSFLLTERITRQGLASKNSFYTALFAVLLALGHLVSALFPSLESHLAQIFFGDLATLANQEAKLVAAFSAVLLPWLVIRYKHYSNLAFEVSALGLGGDPKVRSEFAWVTLLTLALSVQFVGLLFTLSCLFLPTVVLKRCRGLNLRSHLILSGAVAFSGCLGGLTLSLLQTRLPTVPCITITTALLATMILSLRSAYSTRHMPG